MTLNQTRRACICLMLFAAMWHRDFVFAATLHCDFLPVTKTQERSRLRHAKARHQGAALCGCCCCGSAVTVCFVACSFSRYPSLLISDFGSNSGSPAASNPLCGFAHGCLCCLRACGTCVDRSSREREEDARAYGASAPSRIALRVERTFHDCSFGAMTRIEYGSLGFLSKKSRWYCSAG